MGNDVKTFRGRSLEEILPQIRSELGPDAIVLRRREGLAGGVGGFFQKTYVEVEARAPLDDEVELEARNDRATAEGLETPAIQALVSQASPFADALARAEGTTATPRDRAADVLLAAAAAAGEVPAEAPAAPVAAGLYGPQPRIAAPAPAVLAIEPGSTMGEEPILAAPTVPEPEAAAPMTPPVSITEPEAPAAVTPAPEPEAAETGRAPWMPSLGPVEPDPEPSPEPAPAPAPAMRITAPAAPPVWPPVAVQPAAPAPVPVVPAWPPAAPVAVAPVAPPVPAWPPVAPAPAAAPPAPAIAVEPDLPPAPRTPPAAALAEQRLVTAGLTPALAAEVVGETVAHVVPFHADADLDGLVRASLARRISIMSGLGTGRRVLAVAGSGGAGKSAIVARLAARYAASEHEVVVIALGTRDGGGELADQLEPLGVSVIAAADAEQAQRRMRHREPTLCIVDTPALGVHDAAAAAALAPQLRALGCTEVHLAVPATVSAVAADEVATALAPLGITHMAITNVDQTARPGAVVELALRTGRPVSYLGSRERVELADAGVLAARLLP